MCITRLERESNILEIGLVSYKPLPLKLHPAVLIVEPIPVEGVRDNDEDRAHPTQQHQPSNPHNLGMF